ncbi:lyase family protein, partial [Desulfocurvibacter africanus]
MADKKLWGGRFTGGTDALVEAYTESVSFDRHLWAEDIAGSKAHARMLARQGVIPAEDAQAIVAGLEAVQAEIEQGEFSWRTDREDVHMNIEARLTELI